MLIHKQLQVTYVEGALKLFMTAELETIWKETAVHELKNTLVGLRLKTRTPTDSLNALASASRLIMLLRSYCQVTESV
jgi:hypothetical protein